MADNQQTPPNVSEDEFFNKYKPNVSEDEFFNKYSPQAGLQQNQSKYFDQGPYAGHVSDFMFSTANSMSKILSAFGQGAKDSWGANGGSIYQDEIGWEAKHKDEDHSLVYGLHTSLFRPLAAALDAGTKIPFAAGGGFAGALGQAGEEIKKVPVIGQPIGELAQTAAAGAIPEGLPHVGVPDYAQIASEARAKGVIGEGEGGFYGTRKPTTDDLEARNEAAANAGFGPETFNQFRDQKNVLPTQRDLARQIDPDTFKTLDELQDMKENLQLSLQQERTKRQQALETGVPEEHPEMKKQFQGMTSLQERLQETDEKLRDLIPDVSEAENRAKGLIESPEPEGDMFRDLVQAQAFERALEIEKLKPRIRKAYRDAADLIPPEEPKNGTTPGKTPAKSSPVDSKPTSAAAKILEPEGLSDVLKESKSSRLTPVEGTGGEKESSVNKNLEAELIQKGYEGNVSKDTGYKVLNHDQQGMLALDYMTSNPKEAFEVAMGDREPPEGIHPEAVLVAAKRQAEHSNDIDTLRDLARSRLGREATTMGQRIGLLRYLYDEIDPTEIIKNIQDAWENKGKTKLEQKVAEIKKAQQDAIQKFKPDYEAFLKSIECE